MSNIESLGAAIIGTGFIGTVHAQMLRRLGVNVRGILGSSAKRGAEQASAMGVSHSYANLDELLADERIDIVHITSPNYAHFEHAKSILLAGKHVVCEKPLALTSTQSHELAEIAENSGKVAAVCYVYRHFALNQQARGMVDDGSLGDVRLVSGHFHQDWLALPTDWNWRLDSELGGELRSVSDIGTHWLDLVSFITGSKVESVFADLITFLPKREKPNGPVESFSSATGNTTSVNVDTDDSATIMLRLENGARGIFSTSQINIGRKNSMCWDIAGSRASAAWDNEKPDHLFIGHRDKPNEVLMRDFNLMNERGVAAASLPPGHVEGFADCFYAFFKAVYDDVLAGARSETSSWATFKDGHYEMQICNAILKSSQEGRWVTVKDIDQGATG